MYGIAILLSLLSTPYMSSAAPIPSGPNYHVYLAGPSVFLENSTDTARSQIATCSNLSLVGVHPLREVIEELDGTLPPGVQSPDNRTDQDWYQADVDKIHESAGIIAEISAFRGPSMDPGTAFELGYAVSRGLKVALWSDTWNTTYHGRVEADTQLATEKGIASDVLGPGQWADVDRECFSPAHGVESLILDTINLRDRSARPLLRHALVVAITRNAIQTANHITLALNATENLMITRPDTPVYATFGDAAVAMAKLLGAPSQP